MHVELMFPKEYLKAADIQELGRDLTITIKEVRLEELAYAGGRKEKKWVVHRKGRAADGKEPKKFVLNVTNARMVAQVTGENDCDNWPGHRVTLYATTCQGQKGEIVDCIRVRPTKPPAKGNGGPPPTSPTGGQGGAP